MTLENTFEKLGKQKLRGIEEINPTKEMMQVTLITSLCISHD